MPLGGALFRSSSFTKNEGCDCPSASEHCSETETLDIIRDFKRLYEDQLRKIDTDGGGDCLELKVKLQQRWIEDLTAQTEMMAKVVKELEMEATERVRMLEDKLQHSAKCACEVMKRYHMYDFTVNSDETFQKLYYMENDLKNLLEFVRRIREDGRWTIDGLQFYDVTHDELFGTKKPQGTTTKTDGNVAGNQDKLQNEEDLILLPKDVQDKLLIELKKEIRQLRARGDSLELSEELKKRTEEYEDLRKSMLDMRTALTEEVASKHDVISLLRKDIQQLEERCLQADKQTAFKDDIIKEMRKEIKQAKQQDSRVSSVDEQCLAGIIDRLKVMKEKVQNHLLTRKEMSKKIQKLERQLDEKTHLLSQLFSIVRALLCKLCCNCANLPNNIFTPFLKKAIERNGSIDNNDSLTAATKQLGDVSELKCTVEQLQVELEIAKKSKCTGSCSADTNTGSHVTERVNNDKLIQNKDEVIKIQNGSLNIIQIELQALKQKEKELEDEIVKRQDEVDKLKCKCNELESTLVQSQERATNLQKAVDLYVNSVNLLEKSESRLKIEYEQQKMTIANLQEALVDTKLQLDELKEKNQQDVGNLIESMTNLMKIESKRDSTTMELVKIHKRLQDVNFELEIEHFNSLQDIAMLETQVTKYQIECREDEDNKIASKNEVKKLRQQKRCYEQVVAYFKHEMAVMSEQLEHLQDILNISNRSCREENEQLSQAVLELQNLNARLQSELNENEHKVAIENHMNRVKETKIDELSKLVQRKELDLTKHDKVMYELKKKLENSMLENHELQSAVCHMQCVIQAYELEKSKGTASSSPCSVETDKEEEMTAKKLVKLQADYDHQKKLLTEATKQLQELKEKQEHKIQQLSQVNDDIRKKLIGFEQKNCVLCDECNKLKEKNKELAQQQCKKDVECQQYKQIVGDLRQTMLELNGSLAESEINKTHLCQEFVKTHQHKIKEVQKEQDFSMKCRCEIALYKKLIDNFKTTIIQLTKQLNEAANQNAVICKEMKIHESKVIEYQKRLGKKEQELCELRHEMMEKSKRAEAEENRLAEFIAYLKRELENKNTRNNNDGTMTLASTQEEISSLKDEIKKMIGNQVALNNENDKLLNQLSDLQNTTKSIEEQNRALRSQLDGYLVEIGSLKDGNRHLYGHNEQIVDELQKVRCYCDQLERKLHESKNNRDDICAESRQVVNNVKLWLEEQRKINNDVRQRVKYYCNTKEEMQESSVHCECPVAPPAASKVTRFARNVAGQTFGGCSPVNYNSPWSLGSQGTASFGRDSPSSCLSCSVDVDEWYSPTYRDDDETDDHEEEFVRKVENLTTQMACSNKCWKNKSPPDYLASKDNK